MKKWAGVIMLLLCSVAWTQSSLPKGCFYAQGGILCDAEGYKAIEGPEEHDYKIYQGSGVRRESDVPVGKCKGFSHPQYGWAEICNNETTNDDGLELISAKRPMLGNGVWSIPTQSGEMFNARVVSRYEHITPCRVEWTQEGMSFWCEDGKFDVIFGEN